MDMRWLKIFSKGLKVVIDFLWILVDVLHSVYTRNVLRVNTSAQE